MLLESKVDGFTTNGKMFCMNLCAGTCHKRSAGICSLSMERQARVPFENIVENKGCISRNEPEYCQSIATSLKDHFDDNGFPINLEQCFYGHYAVVNGQHRLCISSKIKIPITVYISGSEEPCPYCRTIHDLTDIKGVCFTLLGKGHYRLVKL